MLEQPVVPLAAGAPRRVDDAALVAERVVVPYARGVGNLLVGNELVVATDRRRFRCTADGAAIDVQKWVQADTRNRTFPRRVLALVRPRAQALRCPAPAQQRTRRVPGPLFEVATTSVFRILLPYNQPGKFAGARLMQHRQRIGGTVIAALLVIITLSSVLVHSQGGAPARFVTPPDQVIAVRAGRLFDSRSGTLADEPGHPHQRRSHHARRARARDSARGAGDRLERGHGDAGNDRRARPSVSGGQSLRIHPHHRRRRECADRSERRLHHRARHGLARWFRHRRSAQRDQPRPGDGSADAGGRTIAQPAGERAVSVAVRPLHRPVHRGQEPQLPVAGARGRARGEAARRGLGEDLHDPGFRRRRVQTSSSPMARSSTAPR